MESSQPTLRASIALLSLPRLSVCCSSPTSVSSILMITFAAGSTHRDSHSRQEVRTRGISDFLNLPPFTLAAKGAALSKESTRTKMMYFPNHVTVNSLPCRYTCWRWGGRRPKQLRAPSRLRPFALSSHFAQGLHAFVSAVGGRRDVFLCNLGTATNVRFDGLRGMSLRAGCAMQLNIFEKAGGRQEPRHREAGRRKDGTTMTRRTPRKGRLRPVKLQPIQSAAVSTCCQFWFTQQRGSHVTDAVKKCAETPVHGLPAGKPNSFCCWGSPSFVKSPSLQSFEETHPYCPHFFFLPRSQPIHQAPCLDHSWFTRYHGVESTRLRASFTVDSPGMMGWRELVNRRSLTATPRGRPPQARNDDDPPHAAEGPPQVRREEGAHPSWRAHLHFNESPSHSKVLVYGEPISISMVAHSPSLVESPSPFC